MASTSTAQRLVACYAGFLLVLAVCLAIGLRAGYSVEQLFEDPARGHRLFGVFTYVGGLLWCTSAAVCLFSSALLRRAGNVGLARFTAAGGVLSLILLVDDLFLFHEWMQSHVKVVGENGVFAAYAVLVATFLVTFRRTIFASDFVLLIVALGLFAVSLLIDVVIEPWLWQLGGWSYAVEDVPKLLGVLSWLGYFAKFCYLACSDTMQTDALSSPLRRASPRARSAASSANCQNRKQRYE